MKKTSTKLWLGAFTLMLLCQQTNAQSTTFGLGAAGHTGGTVAADWSGWSAATTIPFNIEHRGGAAGQTINFLTNSIQRMTITNGNGFVGMGDNLPLGFAPLDRLHLHAVVTTNPAANVFMRYTNGNTGTTATDGLSMGINYLGNAEIINREQRPMLIGVNAAQAIFIDNNPAQLQNTGASNFGGNWIGLGQFFNNSFGAGATPTTAPQAHLHIDGFSHVIPPFGVGLRSWFNTGTLYTEESDGMYVGLRRLNPISGHYNEGYAVINWNDNNNGGTGSDFLSINFTSSVTATPPPVGPNSVAGMEVARFDPGHVDGSASGTFGVGNFMTIGNFTEPTRRVEILDADPQTGTHLTATGTPQLRLTFTYDANVTAPTVGINSEFQATNLGDLAITTTDNTQTNTTAKFLKQRFTGIQTSTPGNSLEINSQYALATTPNGQPTAGLGAPTGWAGLRFTDLKSTSIIQANPGAGVLSVDTNGDVIYVPKGNAIANSGLSINGAVAQLGALCGSAYPARLLQNTEIPLKNFNLIFSDSTGNTGKVGIGKITACTPQNLLEVNNGTTAQLTSGLRLTDLAGATASTPVANGVLSVNSSGDVILVKESGGSTGGSLGNPCGSSPNFLTGNWEIPLANHNFIFSTNSGYVGNVGIGDFTSASCNLGAKLHIEGSPADIQTQIFVQDNNTSLTASYSGIGLANAVSSGYIHKHAVSYSDPNQLEIYNQGNMLIATDYTGDIDIQTNSNHVVNINGADKTYLPSDAIFASHGNLVIEGPSLNGFPYLLIQKGPNQIAQLSTDNYSGVLYLSTTPNPSTPSVNSIVLDAIIGHSNYINNSGNFGINTSNPAATLDVNGTLINSGQGTLSDSTLKTNIHPITNLALQKVKALRAISYEWINKQDTMMYGTQYGFTAQQVATIIPDLVRTDSFGIKSLNYIGIIPFLTKAIQEQQQTIDSLKASAKTKDSIQDARLTALENAVNSCCSGTSARHAANNINSQDISLSDKDVIVLNQNTPNPFAEQTTISYNIPQNTGAAQLLFYDVNGRQIQNVIITTKGAGQLNIYANDLTNGIYSYTLIVDGKIIDTKRMIKQQ